MSLKSQVKEIIENESPEEFNNLILDSLKIESLTEEDKKFLQEFTNLEMLALNQTQLRSLQNLPDCKNLLRLEVNDNKLSGEELAHLTKFSTLNILKCANNQVKSIDELAPLKDLPDLKNLDLSSNPIAETEGYKEKIFELLPKLEILDGCNKNGEDVISDDEGYDDEEYGEEGMPELTEQQIEELKKRGISPAEYFASLQEEGEAEYGEEGEADIYGDEEGEVEVEEYGEEAANGDVLGKRDAAENAEADAEGDANKRAKEE